MHRPLIASRIDAYVTSVCPSQTPGASWSFTQEGLEPVRGWRGFAVIGPNAVPVTGDTLYDLASLTKPLATALVALRAYDAGKLDLEAEAAAVRGGAVTWLQLLRHEAGFPDWLPLYVALRDGREASAWLRTECPREVSDAPVRYSCPGYILLGLLLEDRLGGSLPALFHEWVAAPLGLSDGDACFNPTAAVRVRTAATEIQPGHEEAMAERFGGVVPPFKTIDGRGEVNDGNARFMGGAAGNAGLFGTLGAVEILCHAYRPDGGILSERALDLAWKSPHPMCSGQRRTAGWKACGSSNWWANEYLQPGGIGHEGFTGTGVWMEAYGKTTYILLTNRIHPRHPGTDFGPVRAGFIRAARGAS